MSLLEGRQIVLTGAAGGLGSLLASRLRQRGAEVTGVDRLACGSCDDTMIADLSNPDDCALLGDRLAARRVDILVNVAGLQYFGPLEKQGSGSIALGYAVNLVAPAILASSVVPQMMARGDGHIVNIGSIMGSVPYPYFTAYSSAKAGLKGFSQALRRELRGHGIAVTHFSPRAVRTPSNTEAIKLFMALASLKADEPETIADRIILSIEQRKQDVSIGFAERVFGQLNMMMPRLIDHGLSGPITIARSLFPTSVSGVWP